VTSPATLHPSPAERRAKPRPERRKRRRTTSLFAHGEPMVWLTGGALGIALTMIVGLLALVLLKGIGTFWPSRVVQVETLDGRTLAGEVTVTETFEPGEQVFDALPEAERESIRRAVEANDGRVRRRLLRTGNFDLTNTHFNWISDFEVRSETFPEWMLVVERQSWGRFYGVPEKITIDGVEHTGEPAELWQRFEANHPAVRERWRERRELETEDIGRVNARMEGARLDLREVELAHGKDSPEWERASADAEGREGVAHEEFVRIMDRIGELRSENERYGVTLRTADGVEKRIGLEDVVRAYPANRLGPSERFGVYASRVVEFLVDEPREANSEGGVWPAIFGTVLMTLIMTLLVVPFGVLAALYLREYAKPGPIVSAVRVAINNLAGVPSIVFGVFGLGFFCYIVGARVDELFFGAKLPTPTFGKGGLLWASLTLALLTLPVVIVPTEEALAAVPGSMREGSYACGATKWQTIRRIVLPRAMPGIMTGAILALARGAGEVAPLMLVGAVKLAPELPLDGTYPFFHPERSFMHLGFHIYDLGFQSQNSEAAKPMVYTTTLLLIGLVVLLNVVAIWVRARLRRRFVGVHV